MIQTETLLNVADNSGAKKVLCIRVLGGTRRRYARIGDIIVVTVKEAIPHSKVKKGDVMRAVVVRTAKEIKRWDDTSVKFDENGAVLLSGHRRTDWYPYIWPGGKRTASFGIYEDNLPGP